MRKRFLCSMLLLMPVVAAAWQPARAQSAAKAASKPAPRTVDGKPDLSGVWAPPRLPGEQESLPRQGPREPWVMTPWAKAQYDYNFDPTEGINAHGARLELHPRFAHCIPYSPTQLNAGNLNPFEVLQTPRKVVLFYEMDNMVRQIFTDGRQHPKDLEPTWEGHTIGHWEGDTLVAETIGMREETWLDNDGHVHSDQLRLTERIRRLDHDTLQISMTMEDPKALEKPYTQHIFRKLRPDWDIREETRCTENIKRGMYSGEFTGTQ